MDDKQLIIRQRHPVAAYPRAAIAERHVQADALISIGSLREEPIDPEIIRSCFGERTLRLQFSDIPVAEWKDYHGPRQEDVMIALRFAEEIRNIDDTSTIAVHCAQGVSRSTAIALAIITSRLQPGQEEEAVRQLMRTRANESLPPALASIQIAPNPGIVAITDRLLNRNGALHRALINTIPRYVTWCAYWSRKLEKETPDEATEPH